MSFFSSVKSFADVPVKDEGVDTLEFLEAAEGIVKLFDLFNSKAFGVVQSDLTGNIEKTRTRYNQAQDRSKTIESLINSEYADKQKTARQGFLWLLRGLKFTALGLRNNIKNKEQELSDSFTKAYENSLKPHHGIVVRPVFTLAMKACPYRKDFYEKLRGEAEMSDEELAEFLEKYLEALEAIVARLEAFYETNNYAKGL